MQTAICLLLLELHVNVIRNNNLETGVHFDVFADIHLEFVLVFFHMIIFFLFSISGHSYWAMVQRQMNDYQCLL